MTIDAGPLLASLVDLERVSTAVPAGQSDCLPLVLSLIGILLAYLLTLRIE